MGSTTFPPSSSALFSIYSNSPASLHASSYSASFTPQFPNSTKNSNLGFMTYDLQILSTGKFSKISSSLQACCYSSSSVASLFFSTRLISILILVNSSLNHYQHKSKSLRIAHSCSPKAFTFFSP